MATRYGLWLPVVEAVVGVSMAAAGAPGGAAGAKLVSALAGITLEQDDLLKAVGADTELLRGADLATAMLLLTEADRHQPTPDKALSFVVQARDLLYRAVSLCKSNAERSIVQHQLALVYLRLEQHDDAAHWLDQALASAERAIDALIVSASYETKGTRTRFADGRTTNPALMQVRGRDLALMWTRMSPLSNVVAIPALAASGLGQLRLRSARRSGRDAVSTLLRFVQYRNACQANAARLVPKLHDCGMCVLRKEPQLFSPPIMVLRSVPSDRFVGHLDMSMNEDLDALALASPTAFGKRLLQQLLEESRRQRSREKS